MAEAWGTSLGEARSWLKSYNRTILRINSQIINADTPLLETAAKNAVIEYGLSNHGVTTSSKIMVFDKFNFLTNTDNKLEYLPQPPQK